MTNLAPLDKIFEGTPPSIEEAPGGYITSHCGTKFQRAEALLVEGCVGIVLTPAKPLTFKKDINMVRVKLILITRTELMGAENHDEVIRPYIDKVYDTPEVIDLRQQQDTCDIRVTAFTLNPGQRWNEVEANITEIFNPLPSDITVIATQEEVRGMTHYLSRLSKLLDEHLHRSPINIHWM